MAFTIRFRWYWGSGFENWVLRDERGSMDLCYPYMFVHVRDIDVQIVLPCFSWVFWLPVPGLWACGIYGWFAG